jgi:hypothetical protein
LERRIALPLGLVFWVVALACLTSGVVNYVKTVERYGRRQALVQSGWGTQVVSFAVSSSLLVGLRFVLMVTGSGIHGCRYGYCCGVYSVFDVGGGEDWVTIAECMGEVTI